MILDVQPFSMYNYIISNGKLETLIGSQCIYPIKLQNALISTFLDQNSDSSDLKIYCFKLNDTFVHPTYTYEDDLNFIFVSDEFYNQYFKNNDNAVLNTNYNMPKVDMIKLKRIDGDFPQDGSIDSLLTQYLESCIIVNMDQEFRLEFYTNENPYKNYIVFKVDELIYTTEPVKDIKHRLEELNLTMIFNKYLTNSDQDLGLQDCTNIVTNFEWNYNTIGNKIKLAGYVANLEVKIDFIVTEPEPIKKIKPLIEPFIFSSKTTNTNSNEPTKELTKEEIRLKRLAFFSNTQKSPSTHCINNINKINFTDL
jgi:hypothetical protein